MEFCKLSNELKYVEINGVTLNIDERTRLDLGCMELASDIKCNKMYFWGKIRGKFDKQLLVTVHSIITEHF